MMSLFYHDVTFLHDVTSLPLQSPNFMQKIKKILRAVSEKTALPTNQLLPTTLILQNVADADPKKFITTPLKFVVYKFERNAASWMEI